VSAAQRYAEVVETLCQRLQKLQHALQREARAAESHPLHCTRESGIYDVDCFSGPQRIWLVRAARGEVVLTRCAVARERQSGETVQKIVDFRAETDQKQVYLKSPPL
jgi:hypothetical protein